MNDKNFINKISDDLNQNGFLVLQDILNQEELKLYKGLYEDFITGKLDATNHRHDLGNHVELKTTNSKVRFKLGYLEHFDFAKYLTSLTPRHS